MNLSNQYNIYTCNLCEKLIPLSQPVFMREDMSFCSYKCRYIFFDEQTNDEEPVNKNMHLLQSSSYTTYFKNINDTLVCIFPYLFE